RRLNVPCGLPKYHQLYCSSRLSTLLNGKIYIIGIGNDGLAGLTAKARDLILSADLVLGSDNTLSLMPELKAERYRIGADLQEVVRTVESNASRRLVIVASGDPLFYGVARYLCDRLGKECFEVLPHVSSMQLAFALKRDDPQPQAGTARRAAAPGAHATRLAPVSSLRQCRRRVCPEPSQERLDHASRGSSHQPGPA